MSADSLRPHDRVRITVLSNARWTGGHLDAEWTEGAFDRLRNDTLVFQPAGYGREPVTIAAPWISRMEIAHQGRRHSGRGMLIGLGIGLGVDMIVASNCGNCLFYVPIATPVGLLTGLLVGSVRGSSWAPVAIHR